MKLLILGLLAVLLSGGTDASPIAALHRDQTSLSDGFISSPSRVQFAKSALSTFHEGYTRRAEYTQAVDTLFRRVQTKAFQSGSNVTTAWDRLAELTALENSIDWMAQRAKADGFDVHTEDVTIPKWTRGEESATLITDTWTTNLAVVGLGFSPSTPPEGIKAPVYVVSTLEELETVGAQGLLRDKIVLVNHKWEGYGTGSKYRQISAERAAQGALACLIQSVTPYSMRSPHTGTSKRASIPAAALAVEDANIVSRIFARSHGTSPVLHLTMASELGTAVSRNTVIELRGTERPDEVILLGGHIDSWDKGVGAVDDGAGFMVTYQALYLLRHVAQYVPRRTLRVVLFTAKETGVFGGNAYYGAHRDEQVLVALESDEGVFTPRGLTLGGAGLSEETFEGFVQVGESVRQAGGRGWHVERGGAGEDVAKWCSQAVCGQWMSDTPDDVYFRYHHTSAAMMEALDPADLEEVAATFAAYAMALS
ncbi:hypothetical protein H9P43_001815 [Blastocladiella emersonii ATCC 22665]|nr:hypothetical protein H9P43_001815 [Blastocladiella emersonii ATCC 22665]